MTEEIFLCSLRHLILRLSFKISKWLRWVRQCAGWLTELRLKEIVQGNWKRKLVTFMLYFQPIFSVWHPFIHIYGSRPSGKVSTSLNISSHLGVCAQGHFDMWTRVVGIEPQSMHLADNPLYLISLICLICLLSTWKLWSKSKEMLGLSRGLEAGIQLLWALSKTPPASTTTTD